MLEGKYRIVRLIGEGGMGTVYEAEHTVTHKRIAIKCMRPELANKPKAAERLIQEARAVARIRHPNVVDVYDVGRDGELIYLVMEYLEGEPLTALLERGGLPMHQLIALLLPALRGVAAAHRQGVVHRDIKPDNIFFARVEDTVEPVAKVIDFGVSKLDLRGAEPLSLTRSGSAVGTPLYMPFEQLRGQKDLDARADVYAFGVVLYEALTGRLPYEVGSVAELVYKVLNGGPAALSTLRPEIPTTLDRLVLWAMAREREQRIPSMDALIMELTPFASERGFRAEMAQDEGPLPLIGERPVEGAPNGEHNLAQLSTVPATVSALGEPKRLLHVELAQTGKSRPSRTTLTLTAVGVAVIALAVLRVATGALLAGTGAVASMAAPVTAPVAAVPAMGPSHAEQPSASTDPTGSPASGAATAPPAARSEPALSTRPVLAAPAPASLDAHDAGVAPAATAVVDPHGPGAELSRGQPGSTSTHESSPTSVKTRLKKQPRSTGAGLAESAIEAQVARSAPSETLAREAARSALGSGAVKTKPPTGTESAASGAGSAPRFRVTPPETSEFY